jgi:ribose transport system permease protein
LKKESNVDLTKRKAVVRFIFNTREIGIFGAALIVFITLSLASPHFLRVENLLLVARQISILSIIATGMTLIFIAREIDAMGIVIIIGAVIGLVNGLFTTMFGMPSFIVTLGMLGILRGSALILSGAWPIIIKLPEEHSFLNITAGYVFKIVPAQIFWMIGIMLIAGFVLSKTRFGAHVYATGGNEEAARLSGIPVKRIKIITFMITGVLCGVAATLLLGQVKSAFPLAGTGFEIDVIAAVVIGGTQLFGGRGSILGTLLGALIIGMITNGLVLLGVNAYVEPLAKGCIIIIAVLINILTRRK